MKNIVPIGKMVLINVINKEQTVGGIVLPEAHQNDFNEIIVEAVGDEVTKIKPGDSILAVMQNGIKVDFPYVEKNKVLIHEQFILGKLTKKE